MQKRLVRSVYITKETCTFLDKKAAEEDRTFTHIASRILEKAVSELKAEKKGEKDGKRPRL